SSRGRQKWFSPHGARESSRTPLFHSVIVADLVPGRTSGCLGLRSRGAIDQRGRRLGTPHLGWLRLASDRGARGIMLAMAGKLPSALVVFEADIREVGVEAAALRL